MFLRVTSSVTRRLRVSPCSLRPSPSSAHAPPNSQLPALSHQILEEDDQEARETLLKNLLSDAKDQSKATAFIEELLAKVDAFASKFGSTSLVPAQRLCVCLCVSPSLARIPFAFPLWLCLRLLLQAMPSFVFSLLLRLVLSTFLSLSLARKYSGSLSTSACISSFVTHIHIYYLPFAPPRSLSLALSPLLASPIVSLFDAAPPHPRRPRAQLRCSPQSRESRWSRRSLHLHQTVASFIY